jgi:GNAT superfamily N-acetyltransferase
VQPPLIRTRPAVPADIPAVFAMKRCLAEAAGAGAALVAGPAEWLRDAFGAAPRFRLVVAENGAAIIGMISFNELYMTALGGSVFAVQDLFVAPSDRKHGVGRALVAAVAGAALAQGIPLIELAVSDANQARKFYRRLGFRHLKECMTYAIGGQAMLDLAVTATRPGEPVLVGRAGRA